MIYETLPICRRRGGCERTVAVIGLRNEAEVCGGRVEGGRVSSWQRLKEVGCLSSVVEVYVWPAAFGAWRAVEGVFPHGEEEGEDDGKKEEDRDDASYSKAFRWTCVLLIV